ncbi:MAG: amidinotransferase [Parvularculaceae bacterium]|nr:amidinotransferase [Parvularculaceae bacterium]
MIRPLHFAVNAETAADNSFQAEGSPTDTGAAVQEFDAMVDSLRAAGVVVHVIEQDRTDTPDAVFPNNWFSTHADGTLVIYPMAVPSRRRERRQDIIDRVATAESAILDLSHEEEEGRILEGTGAIVFDHRQRCAFLTKSRRAEVTLFEELCDRLTYRVVAFDAAGRDGSPIYHTNVMMAVGQHLALAGLTTIGDDKQRSDVRRHLAAVDRPLIELTAEQIESFAGNALEIDTPNGPVLVMSATGWASLNDVQRDQIESVMPVITPQLPTIEKSGGSARCMMAGLHGPTA